MKKGSVLIAMLLLSVGAWAGVDAAAETEAVGFLRDLIRIDTTNPPGNEAEAAKYIKRVFDREDIPAELVDSAPGRSSVVARLTGSGRARPILLMAHLDVVGVERSKWSVDPFAAEMRDGYIYGRGAADDKAMAAANLELMLLLKRSRVPLERDVIYLAEAGEEGTPEFGIQYLLEHTPEKIDAEYALNESGDAPMDETSGRPRYVAIATGEKTPHPVKLVAHGSSGHGAFPKTDNAIAHLALALANVVRWSRPPRLNATTREFFARIAEIDKTERGKLASDPTLASSQDRLHAVAPNYWAMLRTTVTPTMLSGGFRVNVVPAEATATLDVRMLPDEDPGKFIAELREVVADPAITIEENLNPRPVSPVSQVGTAMYRALQRAYQTEFPDVPTLPQMVPGANDCAMLRVRGVQCYGVAVPMAASDRGREHGNDERVPVAGVAQYLRVMFRAVTEIAGAK